MRQALEDLIEGKLFAGALNTGRNAVIRWRARGAIYFAGR